MSGRPGTGGARLGSVAETVFARRRDTEECGHNTANRYRYLFDTGIVGHPNVNILFQAAAAIAASVASIRLMRQAWFAAQLARLDLNHRASLPRHPSVFTTDHPQAGTDHATRSVPNVTTLSGARPDSVDYAKLC